MIVNQLYYSYVNKIQGSLSIIADLLADLQMMQWFKKKKKRREWQRLFRV